MVAPLSQSASADTESLDAIVKLSIKALPDARTAETLGAERDGTGVVIDDHGLILTIGVGLGLISGYFGGIVDDLVMRIVDVLLAFPALILALAIVGTLGPGSISIIIGIVAVAWADYARVMRGLVLAAREQPYVESARAVGATHPRIILRHLLPNVVPPIVVLASLEMGGIILAVLVFPLLFMVMSSLKPDAQLLRDTASIRAFLPVGDISLDNYDAMFERVPAEQAADPGRRQKASPVGAARRTDRRGHRQDGRRGIHLADQVLEELYTFRCFAAREGHMTPVIGDPAPPC